jgi:hypothetical protein
MSDDTNNRIAVSVKQRLLNLAKQRGEDYNLVLTRYALERFLYRLSCSQYRRLMVLKGAMLFQIWSQTPHRATRDLDLWANGNITKDEITAILVAICKIAVEPDGLVFDTDGLTVRDIREDSRYGGVRAKFSAKLGSEKSPYKSTSG